MAASGRRGAKSGRGKATGGTKKKKDEPKNNSQVPAVENAPPQKETGGQAIEKNAQERAKNSEDWTGVPVTAGPSVENTDDGGAKPREVEQNNEEEVNDIGDLDRDIEDELGEVSDEEDDGDTGGDLWTPRKEDKLIDFFERCTFLYDKELDDYRLRNKKIRAYNVFANKLGVTCK